MLLSLFCSSSSLLSSCFPLLSSSHMKSTKNKKSSTVGQLDWLVTDAVFTRVVDALNYFTFCNAEKKVHSHFSWNQICQWAKINPAVFKTFLLVLVIFNNKSLFFWEHSRMVSITHSEHIQSTLDLKPIHVLYILCMSNGCANDLQHQN